MGRLTLIARLRQRLRRQLVETRDSRSYRRTLAILALDRGRTGTEIAQMLGVSRQTVHNWRIAFAQAPSLATLADNPRSGRPRLLDNEDVDLLYILLGLTPQHFGFKRQWETWVRWGVEQLRVERP